MNKYLMPSLIVSVLVVGGGIAYAKHRTHNSDAMMKKDTATLTAASAENSLEMAMHMKEQETMAMKKDAGAAFIDFTTEADAQKLVSEHGKDVIYFFDASWCPDCQTIQKHLENSDDLAKLGKNSVMVKVDYDKQKDLKSKYAITHQTAFVRIDGGGRSIKQEILSNYDDVLNF